MKNKILGWGKITPKKTGKECYLLTVECKTQDDWHGVRTRDVFCSLETAKGLERVQLPVEAEFQKDIFSGRLEVTLIA